MVMLMMMLGIETLGLVTTLVGVDLWDRRLRLPLALGEVLYERRARLRSLGSHLGRGMRSGGALLSLLAVSMC
jgi:hypothetical protein